MESNRATAGGALVIISDRLGFFLEFSHIHSSVAPSLMRVLLTWMMVLCVLAGINSRVLAADGSCVVCFDKVEDCCNEAPSASRQNSPDPEGQKCPVDHQHHRGCCSHTMPLAAVNPSVCRFGISRSSLTAVRHESEVAPDGPFLGSEKPPLI